ncbi:hypothetical protein WSM22_24990 [Cytophagales bacterium WSM2-2]|nr:hypothetical protein WSM22_24990 [Cytophagales bacterium WSM2-2]
MNIQSLHKELLTEIEKNSGQATKHTFLDSYLGNKNPRYSISMPKLRVVVRTWFRSKSFTPKEYLQFTSSLVKGKSSTEKMTAGILLDYSKKLMIDFDPKIYDQWLNTLQGWAEVDTMCYGHFKADDLLDNWTSWKKLLLKLNKSKNINKRRASIVLLCKPLTRTDDKRLRSLTFQLIDSLKSEREILITKAVSWTLRSMVKMHREDLKSYLQKNKQSLPAIAVRETMTKIKTGRKNG